jgi:hypothetical protein
LVKRKKSTVMASSYVDSDRKYAQDRKTSVPVFLYSLSYCKMKPKVTTNVKQRNYSKTWMLLPPFIVVIG